jgi:hypothetical protein
MQLALHTLEGWANYGKWVWPESALEQAKRNTTESIAALRQALETEQEPVAWMHNFITNNVITHIPADIGRHPERWTALYKDPTPCKTCESLARAVMADQTYHEKVIPKREWVGLTDEEIQDLSYLSQKIDEGNSPWFDRLGFAKAIEQALKEKNKW